MNIRKWAVLIEETHTEMGQQVTPPIRRVVAMVVLANPFAGRFVADLEPLVTLGEALGAELAARALATLEGAAIESYGKAAIVGEDGELEHAAALLHPRMGAPIRTAIGGGKALIPSAKKRGGMGCTIDVPLGHKDAAFVRSHFDAIEARITDAPRRDEILLCLALATGGRPLPRVGGLMVAEVVGQDGLR